VTSTRTTRARQRLRWLAGRAWSAAALPLISIVLAAVVGSIVIVVSEMLAQRPVDLGLPATAYSALVRGALGSPNAIIRTLVSSTPLIFGGLSVGLAFRAGLFNIGAQGQFLVGALGAVWVGAMLREAPAVVALPLALTAGMLAGAAWGFVPGLLKATSGAHEVVTTIMLNYTATSFIAWAVSGPLRRNAASASPITTDVGNASLPIVIGQTGHAGILLAIVAVGLVWWLLFKTTRGFEIRTVGANPDAARYAGMRPRYITVLAMAMAGGLAGLAGTSVLLGVTKSMTASFGTTVGFDSIAVALLGRSNPIGIVFAAFLFGAMRAGAPLMQIEAGIPVELIDVLQATILLFLVANVIIRRAIPLADVSTELGTTDTVTRTYGREAAAR
jgi:ABC-type uncharacterized transport system permease subunit